MNDVIGNDDILLITFDTLRYDVACHELEQGKTPTLQSVLPNGQWEKRHSPGSFTYTAHHAFFAGFLPTPVTPGVHKRLFAASFAGSETTAEETFVFEASNLVEGLKEVGYHTACIGGVGFFNKQNELSSVFPNLFCESHWKREFGVTDPNSTEKQVCCALEIIERQKQKDPKKKLFLFLNISALHQPNCFYIPGLEKDTIESHGAALQYVDSQLPALFEAFQKHGTPLVILCSDHGTTYGEDGYTGHRLAHETVWTVPYAEFKLD